MHETTIADSAARGAAMAFDIRELAADFLDDPYPTYQALRQFDPVHCMPDGSYFLTRYDDCLKVYHDTATWSSDKKLDFRQEAGFPTEFRRQPALRESHHKPGVQRSAVSHAGEKAAGTRVHAAGVTSTANADRKPR